MDGDRTVTARGRLDVRRYADVFAAVPVPLLILDPSLTMVDANQAYLRSVGWSAADAERALGRHLFDMFPNVPGQITVDGVDQETSLLVLIQRALETGTTQVVTGMRYDIPVPGSDRFVVRHWNVTEVPLRAADGTVELLLHFNEDITALVERQADGEAVAAANAQLQERVARAQVDLLRRAQELERLNARLRAAGDHDRSVAAALQQAMLTELPDVPGLELSARYRTAAAGDRVGGDWYDAVVLPGGSTALVIGDVVGHDIGAAAVMGQLRSMLRAFAWQLGGPPSAVLRQLDRAMRDLRTGTFATAVLADVERDGATTTLRWCNAGHPPPVLVYADGASELLQNGRADLMLGVLPDVDRHDHAVELPAGSAVLFYTDGLVETRDDALDHGLDRLREALTRHRGRPVEELVDAVLADMVGDHPDDDVAVLLVRPDQP